MLVKYAVLEQLKQRAQLAQSRWLRLRLEWERLSEEGKAQRRSIAASVNAMDAYRAEVRQARRTRK
jgi:hypothetical protein